MKRKMLRSLTAYSLAPPVVPCGLGGSLGKGFGFSRVRPWLPSGSRVLLGKVRLFSQGLVLVQTEEGEVLLQLASLI